MSNEKPANDAEAAPKRDKRHDELSVFLGSWKADGLAFGGPDQPLDDPRSRPAPWSSVHTARWHTGEFFLIQDERAQTGGKPFDTLSILGVDPKTGAYFAQTFENHGFERRYDVTASGRVWTFSGAHERANITFSDDGRTQTILWEWKPGERWLPLCDRTATRAPFGQARA